MLGVRLFLFFALFILAATLSVGRILRPPAPRSGSSGEVVAIRETEKTPCFGMRRKGDVSSPFLFLLSLSFLSLLLPTLCVGLGPNKGARGCGPTLTSLGIVESHQRPFFYFFSFECQFLVYRCPYLQSRISYNGGLDRFRDIC